MKSISATSAQRVTQDALLWLLALCFRLSILFYNIVYIYIYFSRWVTQMRKREQTNTTANTNLERYEQYPGELLTPNWNQAPEFPLYSLCTAHDVDDDDDDETIRIVSSSLFSLALYIYLYSTPNRPAQMCVPMLFLLLTCLLAFYIDFFPLQSHSSSWENLYETFQV